jgi:hypothetical protein
MRDNQVMRDEKPVFRNVAVPLDVYEMLDALAREDHRSKARQLSVLIRRAHEDVFGKVTSS